MSPSTKSLQFAKSNLEEIVVNCQVGKSIPAARLQFTQSQLVIILLDVIQAPIQEKTGIDITTDFE